MDTIRGIRRALARARVLVALLALAGCRSETPPNEAQDNAASAPATAQMKRKPDSAPASAPTSAPTVLNYPPGGCVSPMCHADLARVAYRHAPVQAGACDSCHEPEQPEHKFPLKRSLTETCTFCHQVTGHQPHVHAAVEKDGCLSCHNPHGSDTKFLLTGASTELTCRRCHDIERKGHLHGPFAGGHCTACHRPHESDNPHLLVGGAGTDHCLLCHRSKQQQLLAATHLHEPLKEGCNRCHTPHSSDYGHLLKSPVEQLCFECHADVREQVAEAQSPHGAVLMDDRCGNCHDPHAEGRPHLLRDELPAVCLRCHDKPQQAHDGRTIPDMRPVLRDRKSLHGPVRAGQCNACHAVHGSQNSKLLRKYFPPEFYTAFDLSTYALCFECHSQGVVLEKETTTLTNFRDGDRNLHYVHVNRPQKGRTCRSCHEIHGSNLPRHMASEVPFEGGGWSLPIKFEPTPAGGRCSPGCHEAKEYRRTLVTPPPTRGGAGPPEKKVTP